MSSLLVLPFAACFLLSASFSCHLLPLFFFLLLSSFVCFFLFLLAFLSGFLIVLYILLALAAGLLLSSASLAYYLACFSSFICFFLLPLAPSCLQPSCLQPSCSCGLISFLPQPTLASRHLLKSQPSGCCGLLSSSCSCGKPNNLAIFCVTFFFRLLLSRASGLFLLATCLLLRLFLLLAILRVFLRSSASFSFFLLSMPSNILVLPLHFTETLRLALLLWCAPLVPWGRRISCGKNPYTLMIPAGWIQGQCASTKACLKSLTGQANGIDWSNWPGWLKSATKPVLKPLFKLLRLDVSRIQQGDVRKYATDIHKNTSCLCHRSRWSLEAATQPIEDWDLDLRSLWSHRFAFCAETACHQKLWGAFGTGDAENGTKSCYR